jgi:hypothetical protein
MRPELFEEELMPRAERILAAFDFGRCLELTRRFGRRPAGAVAYHRDAATGVDDLRGLLINAWRGDPDRVEYSAAGGFVALRDGPELRLYFTAEEMMG